MFGLTQVDSSTPQGGKMHSYMPSGSSTSPAMGPVTGMKPYSTSNPMSYGFGKPTDAGDDQNLTDRNRVSMHVPAYVDPTKPDFVYPAGTVVFVWGAKDTIDRSTQETYKVMTISSLNEKMEQDQSKGFSVIEALAFGKRRPPMFLSTESREMDRDREAGLDGKMKSFYMDVNSLGRMINVLGPPFADTTQGTTSAYSILKRSGGCIITVIHEGSADMGNLWDDLSPGAKANLILTKKSLIDVRNPFQRRCLQLLPLSSATSTGQGVYPIHGVKPTNESISAKRSRINTDTIITKKRVMGEIKDKYDEIGFLAFSNSNNRFCMALNPDVYETSTVTGTIGSVRNHEKKGIRGKETDIIASHVTPTFLDWSWSKYGPEYVVDPKLGNHVYGNVFWNIKRIQGLVYPVGVVTSGLRGKVPTQEDLKASLFTDHKTQMKSTRTIATKSKLTLHIRVQQ